ncbi:hypothetical protein AGMMS49957_01950 [Synergistales bacterium]|nr:hypothetical protein AGMMS49957_01950 [Synergistales bacterium]
MKKIRFARRRPWYVRMWNWLTGRWWLLVEYGVKTEFPYSDGDAARFKGWDDVTVTRPGWRSEDR